MGYGCEIEFYVIHAGHLDGSLVGISLYAFGVFNELKLKPTLLYVQK